MAGTQKRIPWSALALLALCTSCEDDADSVIDYGPLGDPSIAIVQPVGAAGGPVCVEISEDPDFRVPLLLSLEQIVLAPPGMCGNYLQCGHLQLYANEVLNNESAVRSIDLLLRKLADPFHDGSVHEGTDEPDLLPLRVEVALESGESLLDHAGDPVSAELNLVTVPSCYEAGW